MKKVLIVDDQAGWRNFNSNTVYEILGENITINTASCAQEGYSKLLESKDNPYDYILTDMQMESDYLPLFSFEWFIKQIQLFKEYKNTKIIIISATNNIARIAEKYNVDYIPKYKCNDINEYCNKILKK